ncbi:hypothetical protein PMIT1303_01521 [Prochlorococcus sp. MIT 1303]|nr:hypothetical protein PMIT1303_01521 [Prochlorococcus sp. MIT 1303]
MQADDNTQVSHLTERPNHIDLLEKSKSRLINRQLEKQSIRSIVLNALVSGLEH